MSQPLMRKKAALGQLMARDYHGHIEWHNAVNLTETPQAGVLDRILNVHNRMVSEWHFRLFTPNV